MKKLGMVVHTHPSVGEAEADGSLEFSNLKIYPPGEFWASERHYLKNIRLMPPEEDTKVVFCPTPTHTYRVIKSRVLIAKS